VVEEAILALASYAKTFNPDWVIGMHVGGRLASVLVAKAAGIPKERCGYVRMTTRKEITFERQNGQKKVDVFDGRMLIIDDVSRTGRTFRNLKSFLVERNFLPSTLNNATEAIQNPTVIFSLDTVKFASLLVVSNDEINDGEFRPDWVYRRTSNKSVALPWSDLSEVVRVALENKSKSKPAVGDAKTLLEYETLCESYDVSLEKAELFLRKKSHSGWTRLLSTETKPSRYGIDAVERP
jgi:hypoxanthine phosphoribosyltransferase